MLVAEAVRVAVDETPAARLGAFDALVYGVLVAAAAHLLDVHRAHAIERRQIEVQDGEAVLLVSKRPFDAGDTRLVLHHTG